MPQNWQIAAVAFAVILVILLRWLLSWWLRTTDILRELRVMNAHFETMEERQSEIIGTLRAIQHNTSAARPLPQTPERTPDRRPI